MRVISTAADGVVDADTLFTFIQEGAVVSANYSGGKVSLGYLVGIVSDGVLHFQYAQLDTEDRLDGGSSRCEISKTKDGRTRLIEYFQWSSREGSGMNILEEIPASH